MLPRRERSCYCYLPPCYWAQGLNSLPNLRALPRATEPQAASPQWVPQHSRTVTSSWQTQSHRADAATQLHRSPSVMLLLPALTFISRCRPLHRERAKSRNAQRCCMEPHHTSTSSQKTGKAQDSGHQPGSWLCPSATFSQGILEWTQKRCLTSASLQPGAFSKQPHKLHPGVRKPHF